MEYVLLAVLVGFLLILQGVGLYLTLKKRDAVKPDASFVLLQNQLQELRQTMDSKLGEGTRNMSAFMEKQSEQTHRLMTSITQQVSDQLLEVVRGVTETKESTKQVFTIAEQLQSLERVLKNQKQRGNLGEASLELVLSNVLPGQYESQHLFQNGDKVDFVVKTKDGMVPVDAKFPLENYMRLINETDDQRREEYKRAFKADVKEKIDQTAKYIRPEEGTMPFAFMYIPAEGIYSDLLNNDVGVGINSQDLIEYAYAKKNVLITSPTTFLAYLQTVLFGNQRAKIQEAAKDIIRNVSELSRHLKSYEEAHNSLGKSLNAAVNHYDKSGKAFRLIDKDVVKITGESSDLQLEAVDRPMLGEG